MDCHFALAPAYADRTKCRFLAGQIDKSSLQPYDLGYGKGDAGW